MSTEYNTYECLFLPNLDFIGIGLPIKGEIYNLCRTTYGVYGVGIDNIIQAYVLKTGELAKIYGSTEDGTLACRIGVYTAQNTIYDDLSPQYIVNIEKNSMLDDFFREYGATKLNQVTLTPKKYLVPTDVKNFMSYSFDDRLVDSEKYISCPLEFKLKGYRYRGFDFLYKSYSTSPEYITLYRYDNFILSYTPNDFIREFGGEIFEITEERKVAGAIGGWLTSFYLIQYEEPQIEMHLMQNSAQFNKVDKSENLTNVGIVSGVTRDEFIITHPTFIFELNTIPNFNYVYIPQFNRYYFVESIKNIRYHLYEISLKVDVLMSYKDGIKSLYAFVDRNENDYNVNMIDKRIPFEQGVTVEKIEHPNHIRWLNPDVNGNIPKNRYCFAISGYKFSRGEVEV